MINTTLDDVVTPLRTTINAFTPRITMCECFQRDTQEVTTLNSAISTLKSDVDQLKSTDMSMIVGIVENQNVLDIPADTIEIEAIVEETFDHDF